MDILQQEAQHIVTQAFRRHRYEDARRYEQAVEYCDIDSMEDVLARAQEDPELLAMIEAILTRETNGMPAYDAQDALSRIHRMIEREEGLS